MRGSQFTNIHQLLEYYYGSHNVAKADAPMRSDQIGVYNAVFGAIAFSQLNNEANVFAALPKYPWDHSGWRVITADAGGSATGGVTEGGAIPDAIKATYQEVSTKPKEVAHAFQVSYKHEGFVQKGDDAIGDKEHLRTYFAMLHAKRINEQLCVDGNTLAGANFESIDRVTVSTATAAALSWTSNDEDIYGIDRSSNSWSDAVSDDNATVDRSLTDKLIRDTLSTLQSNGGRTNLIITGSDTLHRIFGIYDTQVRYQGNVQKDQLVRIGINGVETEEGIGVGIRVATLYGIPIIVSQAVQQDTISRLYLLDTTMQEGTGTPRLGISLMYPTLYFESGMSASNPNPFAINAFATEGVYYTAGELICTFFKGQGSIRDLK